MSKHKKDPTCPGCYPERANGMARVQTARQGGYSPLPRCPAHAIDLSKVKVPKGPAPGAWAR